MMQIEMKAAIDPGSAGRLLESLPQGKEALLRAGKDVTKRLTAFMEALDYTVQRELQENSSMLPLKEQKMLEEDLKSQRELQESETSEWDKKFQQMGKGRLWGKWGGSDK
jgi:hypothetical protein